MWVGGTAATNRDTVGCRWSEIWRGSGEGKDQTGGRRHRQWFLESQGDIIWRVISCGDGCERTKC